METNENNTNTLGEQVLAKIQEKRLKPRSKWRFLFHDYFVWTLSALALTIGSVSFGVFLTIFLSNDWDIYARAEKSRIVYGLSVIPYLWIVFLAASLFYANYFFNQTNKGYRYKRSGILVGSVAASAIFGVALYFYGLAQEIDDYFLETIPCYHQITGNHAVLWTNPDGGLLAGVVSATTSGGFSVVDFSGKRWVISYAPPSYPSKDSLIKIIGERSGENAFMAEEIRPWSGWVESQFTCSFAR